MPQLPKIEHEVFARAIVEGMTGLDAYLKAQGELETADARRRKSAKVAANRWITRPDVDARIRELRDNQRITEKTATSKALNIHEITMDKIIGELAKIGFSDVREAIKWGGKLALDDEDGNSVTVDNAVWLVDSEKLPDHIAGAIKSISQTAQGIKIEFHDKKAALLALKEWREKVDGGEQQPAGTDGPRQVDRDSLAGMRERYGLKLVQGGKA
jgi:phage terminase small subunit